MNKKHLLGIKDLSKDEIEEILNQAKVFKEVSQRQVKKTPALRGKTVVNLFFEPSTRTRISFELAAKRLSADVINVASQASSLAKGESLIDTLQNIEALSCDIAIVRHTVAGTPHILAEHTHASVVNAGDGSNEHPTQGLLDMFTVKERLGTLQNLNVVIVGDILHSRVARSNMWGFLKFGCGITLCAPPTLIPRDIDEEQGVRVSYDLTESLKRADVVIMLRIQKERQATHFFPSLREYVRYFSLNDTTAKALGKNTLVLHPGPVNWDTEISSSLKERLSPLILDQVTNGLAVRMAVLYLLSLRKEQKR